jgi:3-methyladenine DNA glycosylase AlkD
MRASKPLGAEVVRRAIREHADADRALKVARFFKTGKGEYGEGDQFLGVPVPELRRIAKQYWALPWFQLRSLLRSPIHEDRFTALIILCENYVRADEERRERIVDRYLTHTTWVNNWDLVDVSAYKILGVHLLDHPRAVLKKLARSKSVWERRIAMVATYELITHDDFRDAFAVADILLEDTHDLIQKAVGWMLREVGKRNRKKLEHFLKSRYDRMPRTMLRYAIEKFPKTRREAYLKGKV